MTQQTKLYEAAMALIGDLINRRSHFNSFQNLCRVLCEYEQSISQPEAIAGEKITYESALDYLSEMGYGSGTNYTSKGVASLLADFASQQTSAKDKEIKELKHELLLNTEINEAINDRINELTKEIDTVKREKLALNLLIDEITDGNCLKQSKAKLSAEIKELKEAISELIQVKDWKDKYGKDEHYLKAMPIAWENVRKLIEK